MSRACSQGGDRTNALFAIIVLSHCPVQVPPWLARGRVASAFEHPSVRRYPAGRGSRGNTIGSQTGRGATRNWLIGNGTAGDESCGSDIVPPALDAYGLTNKRDAHTIAKFVSTYVDRSCEDRGDEELMLVPLGRSEESPDDEWEWEPAKTMAHSIQRGLDHPRRAFALYYPSKVASIVHVSLGFTTDDKLVLGLSVDDEGIKQENLEHAKQLLERLFMDYECYMGVITTEEPVPLSERLFVQAAALPLTMHSRGIG